ncbi:hypothetical protein PAALTS15_13467 [Paenibacillus alvei TS-15]|uniref:Uncharacterized protein n=1 Tax=Paenibacillus alvei TS-15 TaxID=1117108 RepID=S9TWQ2_PAEAL|nr:hypothetical protein [Paenibacillus alvei]EPY06616.1 hypothetical protein PAALTS15_13467 [Paenibacillus alvei TS-15]
MKKVSLASLILLLCFSVFVTAVSAAAGADSGFQSVNNGHTARVYTDSTFYGVSDNWINVTIEKSTSASFSYQVCFTSPGKMVCPESGDMTSSSKTLSIDKSSLYKIIPSHSQGSITVMLKVYKKGDYYTWYGDISTKNTFTAVRPV